MAFIANLPDGRWHGYYTLSEIPPGWSQQERHNAEKALRGIARQNASPTHLRTHGRANLANNAWEMEGMYTEEQLTFDYIVDMVAIELNVNPVAVANKVVLKIHAEGGTWEESRVAASQYKRDNYEEWEEEI